MIIVNTRHSNLGVGLLHVQTLTVLTITVGAKGVIQRCPSKHWIPELDWLLTLCGLP